MVLLVEACRWANQGLPTGNLPVSVFNIVTAALAGIILVLRFAPKPTVQQPVATSAAQPLPCGPKVSLELAPTTLYLLTLPSFFAMTTVTIIGSLAAFLTTIAYVPQAYQTIKTRDTSALSLPTFLILFLGTCLWGAYAVLIHDLPILLTNLISGGLATVILYLKLTAKPGSEKPAAQPL